MTSERFFGTFTIHSFLLPATQNMGPTMLLYLQLLLYPLSLCANSKGEKKTTKHDVFDKLTQSESYDKIIVPRAKNGKPLTVDVTLYVIKIVDMAETGWV